MEPPQTWKPIELQCQSCSAKWNVWQPAGVPVATWAAQVRSHQCPNCGIGNRNVLIRTPDEPPP